MRKWTGNYRVETRYLSPELPLPLGLALLVGFVGGEGVGCLVSPRGVDCESGQIAIPVDGLGVIGAFEGVAVDGFRVGGLFFVGVNVGRLLTGQGVGFLLFGLFIVGQLVGAGVRTCPVGVDIGTLVGDGLNEETGVGEEVGCSVGDSVGRPVG